MSLFSLQDEVFSFIYHHFKGANIHIGPYTSENRLKRYLFFRRLEKCLRLIPPNLSKDSLIVDFGCGQGLFSLLLAKSRFTKIIGTEINSQALEQAREMIKSYNSKHNSDYFIDFRSDPPKTLNIELMCALDVFEHQTPLELQNIVKRYRPRYLLVNLPSENFIYNLANHFKKEEDHKLRYFEVMACLSECGYRVVRHKSLLSLFQCYLLKDDLASTTEV
jgi:SAM-dependent methyltransferase